MASRDRPGKEAKKKPMDKSAKQKLQPMMEPPSNVEVVKAKRKPRTEKSAADEG
jgi:hypothetical protein